VREDRDTVEIKLPCSSCGDQLPLGAFSQDRSAPSRFYRMWTCKDCKNKGSTSGRGNGMDVRKVNHERMQQLEQAIKELTADGTMPTSREVMRHLGRSDDRQIRAYWDILAGQGKVPPRPRKGDLPQVQPSPERHAQLEKDRDRHNRKNAARQAAEEAEIARWRSEHEAIGGTVAARRTNPAVDARAKISAAITKCIVEISRALQDPDFTANLTETESSLVSDEFRLATAARKLAGLLEKIPDTRSPDGGNNPSGAPAKWKDPELVSAVRQRVLEDQPLTGLAATFGIAPGTVERAAIYAKGLIEAENTLTSF
jgi:hypothetical protein